ncbi:NAD-dependent epimerase/dehydratase family protein [soil metagenome]
MRVLVAGSGGFIGSHLVEHFAEQHDVFTLSTRAAVDAARHSVIDAQAPDFGPILSNIRPDVCIACFGAANPNASFAERDADFDLNVIKMRLLLEAIRRNSPGTRLVHLSSAAVYGNPSQLPIREDQDVCPISPYGWHKFQAETICREYAMLGDVPTVSVRIFSCYGPGLRRQLLWDTACKALAGPRLALAGTGQESRDFIFISDLTRAIEAVVLNAVLDGRTINVASGVETTIREVVEHLTQALDWDGEISFSGAVRQGDPLNWRADISRLLETGYRPRISLAEGVAQFADWVRSDTASSLSAE